MTSRNRTIATIAAKIAMQGQLMTTLGTAEIHQGVRRRTVIIRAEELLNSAKELKELANSLLALID